MEPRTSAISGKDFDRPDSAPEPQPKMCSPCKYFGG
jgi:hypothetical protein